jgi:hypothetical protein
VAVVAVEPAAQELEDLLVVTNMVMPLHLLMEVLAVPDVPTLLQDHLFFMLAVVEVQDIIVVEHPEREVLAEAEQVVFQLEVAKSIPAAEVVEEHFKVQEVVEDQA